LADILEKVVLPTKDDLGNYTLEIDDVATFEKLINFLRGE
jgi:hypothetical protein